MAATSDLLERYLKRSELCRQALDRALHCRSEVEAGNATEEDMRHALLAYSRATQEMNDSLRGLILSEGIDPTIVAKELR